MNNTILETIIIGAGHAGLSASYYLKQSGVEHIVFERGRIGETWRSQRWDSFVLNTATSINLLPGEDNTGNDQNNFSSTPEFISSLEVYASKFQLPIAEQTEVISVEKPGGQQYFTVNVSKNGISKNYESGQVIICSGGQNEKKIPAFAENLSLDIVQLHASEYRNASQLPEGAVLVVGSAQSGCQIAEDLAVNGRKVYLATSMVPRVPRIYRGKDIMDWLIMMKFFDARTEDITDPRMLHMPAPHLTGISRGRRTISLQALAQNGVTLLGKMENADAKTAFFQPNAAAHVKFADGFSKKVKDMIDEFILKNQLSMPAPTEDIADMPDMEADCVSYITSLHLEEHTIKSIIWTTGFSGNFNYIKLPVLDNEGIPAHQNGIAGVEGLYFLGLPWLRTRKSGLIYGAKDDAEFINEKVLKYSRQYHSGMLA